MTGWDYDEEYKKELDRPSTWEESTLSMNVDWSTQPTSASRGTVDTGRTNSWNYGPPSRRGGGISPNPHLLPNPQYLHNGISSSTHTNRGGSSSGYSNRGGFFVDHATNAYGAHRRCTDNYDYQYNGYGSPQDYKQCTNQSYTYPQRDSHAQNYNTPEDGFSKLKVSDMAANARDTKVNNVGAFEENQAGSCINFDAYEEIPIEAIGDCVPPPMETFEGMQCDNIVQQNIKRCGYVRPTPVQKHAIPICMNGRDLMACAQTGSGKTAAFCLPIVAGIMRDRATCADSGKPNAAYASCSPLALILSPTRELACQIHAEAKKFAHETRLRAVVLYGGSPISFQLNQLDRGADILVATPGRLKDVIERGRVSLAQVKYLVIDEADRMLDMGFEPQIRCIVEEANMPRVGERQTMLFSATFPREIQELAGDFLANHIFLSVGRVGSSTDLIDQRVEYLNEYNKRNRLIELLQANEFSNSTTGKKLMVVFVETKRKADSLENWLCQMGWHATSIHGDRSQHERERALKSFRSGHKPILVATDVAARGLDVPNVAHVVNYDLPNEIDSYVHRIGRTGRAGKMGTATAFFTEKNLSLAKPLLELLAESNQHVPDWLVKYADLERGGVQGRKWRSNGRSSGHLNTLM